MQLYQSTLDTDHLNLALDEALLTDPTADESLRLWEPPRPLVVLGRSSRLEQEIRYDECQKVGATVARRISGGATIVTGPGCLMYSLVLDRSGRPEIESVDRAHRYVLQTLCEAFSKSGLRVEAAGTSDLTVNDDGDARKVSGNSARLTRNRLLYHGTLLYDFDLKLIARLLKPPPRQPDYRVGREHQLFVTNLPTSREELGSILASAWQADPAGLPPAALQAARDLCQRKYNTLAWNHSR